MAPSHPDMIFGENDFGDPLPPHMPFNDRRPPPPPEKKERAKPFRATHILQPVGLDAWDPRPHPGSQVIPPGTPVKKVAQLGKGKLAFHHVQDREGNTMSVWKQSLQPRQMKPKKPPTE